MLAPKKLTTFDVVKNENACPIRIAQIGQQEFLYFIKRNTPITFPRI